MRGEEWSDGVVELECEELGCFGFGVGYGGSSCRVICEESYMSDIGGVLKELSRFGGAD